MFCFACVCFFCIFVEYLDNIIIAILQTNNICSAIIVLMYKSSTFYNLISLDFCSIVGASFFPLCVMQMSRVNSRGM
jgi:hypothetical protein